jgi:hypothetical protein
MEPIPFLVEYVVLIVSVAFFSLVGYLFFHDIVIAFLNGVLLYVLLYRAYYDMHKDRWKPYAIGISVGIIVEWMLPPLPHLWPITIVLLVDFVVVEILRLAHKRRRR